MSTLYTDAVIIPVDPALPRWFTGWLAVDDAGRISGLGEGTPPTGSTASGSEPEVVDLHGAFLTPGFVSAHSHIYTGGMRGIAHSEPLYTWVTQNSAMLAEADPEIMYWLSRAGGLDHLAAGITSVYNFTQSRVVCRFDYASSTLKAVKVHEPDFVTRQIDGVADAGIRSVTSVRVDDEQLPEQDAVAGFDAAMSHLATIDAKSPALNLGGSVYGAVQWASGRRTAELEKELMEKWRITNQAHFVETAEQIDIQQAKFDWYDGAGVLGTDFAFGHFVHPTEKMVDRVVESGTSVVWQAMSNGRLGSGIADITGLLAKDVTVGMGVDDQSCTDGSDPLREHAARPVHAACRAFGRRRPRRRRRPAAAHPGFGVLGRGGGQGGLTDGRQVRRPARRRPPGPCDRPGVGSGGDLCARLPAASPEEGHRRRAGGVGCRGRHGRRRRPRRGGQPPSRRGDGPFRRGVRVHPGAVTAGHRLPCNP